MPRPTSTRCLSIRVSSAVAVVSVRLLSAILLLFSGCSPKYDDPLFCGPAPVFGEPSIAEHDIAPWDGPAFGLWIPAARCGGKADSWIYLRIWDAPEKSEKNFVFPDESMKVGAATYFLDVKSPRSIDWSSQPRQELKGWVRFIRSNSQQAVVGDFEFVSEEDIFLRGRFEAKWINKSWMEKAEPSDAADSR